MHVLKMLLASENSSTLFEKAELNIIKLQPQLKVSLHTAKIEIISIQSVLIETNPLVNWFHNSSDREW